MQSWIGAPGKFQNRPVEAMWVALHESYTEWRAELRTSVAPFFSRDPGTWLRAPGFGSDQWWRCRVHSIVENMDMAFARPVDQTTKTPDAQISSMEKELQTFDMGDSDEESVVSAHSPQSGDRTGDDHEACVQESDDDEFSDTGSAAEKAKLCGRVPIDCDPADFLGKPTNMNKTRRSAEGNHSRDYERKARDVGLSAPAPPSMAIVLYQETFHFHTSVGGKF